MSTRARTIREQMTPGEKAALCTGANAWQTVAIERLGVPALTVTDGPHGVRLASEPGAMISGSMPATCFPTACALAATWDVGLLREMGKALAEECIALGVDVLLGPGNNIKRTPLCGRNFEYYSEDPFLGAELAASLIQGVQSLGVGTSLKHFAANNQEFQRFVIDAQVDERALREIYLAGFERAVTKAQPWTVMCAYNRLNGTYCSQNERLLTDILRDEWGFEGIMVSDWGAVRDRVAALRAGLELEMPGPQPDRVQALIDAVRSGELDKAVLDRAVERLLDLILKAAETPKGRGEIDVPAHHALARRIAADAIVLLKNEGGLLPLSEAAESLAVIGRSAVEPYYQGGGSSHINAAQVDVPLDELRRLAGDAELHYAPGYTMEEGFDQALIDEAVAIARGAELALLYVALPGFKESEGYDRGDMDLTAQQVALIQAVAAVQPRTVVILNSGSAVAMSEWIDGVPTVLQAWMMGQAGGGAIADVLYGQVNPSGKLAETFPHRVQDTPAYLHYPGENGEVRYGEGIYIGYRYYDARELDVLFPFGYGLSYTTFSFSNLRVPSGALTAGEPLTVSVDMTNTGGRSGKEVVQVYVGPQQARLARPPKELKGFAKVELDPGETATVAVDLDARAFAYYDPAHRQWVTEDGAYDILVGPSSADIRLRGTVRIEPVEALPCLLDRDSTVHEWLADARGAALLGPVMGQVATQMPGGTDGEAPALGVGLMDLLGHVPLPVFLRFFRRALSAGPDEIVDGLLAKVHAAGDGTSGGGERT